MQRIFKQVFSLIDIATSDIGKKLVYAIGYLIGSIIFFLGIYFCIKTLNAGDVKILEKGLIYVALFLLALASISGLLSGATIFITSFFCYRQSLTKGIFCSLISLASFVLLLSVCIWGYYFNLYKSFS